MLPLKNVRVLDLTILRNFTAMELSDHGAEVIKIEQPGCGDPVRTMPPFHRDAALYHSFVNRGKKSVTLDITKSEGKQVFLDLVKTADVVLENFESGTMENLGLGYDVLSAVNPKLVYARLSAFGDNGPCKNYTGSDIVAQARGGCMDITGFPAPNPPYQVGTYVSEHYASTFLSGAIMLALFHARATGIGQKVETSLFDAAFSATEDRVAMVDKSNTGWSRTGNAHPSINPYDIYKCKTGYVAIGISTDPQWQRFCDEFGHPEWINDPKYVTNEMRGEHYFGDLQQKMEEVFSHYSNHEVADRCDKVIVPAAAVNTTVEAINQEQIQAREMITSVDDPQLGTLKMAGSPIKFVVNGKLEHETLKPAPLLGQQTREILGAIMTAEQLDSLAAGGII